MVSFDLGHVLDRLDGYIGKRGTTALVWLTIAVVVVGLFKLLWEWLTPVVAAIGGAVSGTNLRPEWASAVTALIAVVLLQVPAAITTRATRRTRAQLQILDHKAELGIKAGTFALNDAKALRNDLEGIGKRLERIEKKIGLDVPDILPQFMKDVFRQLEGKSPIAYRYTGAAAGEFYHGVPARDLTEDDYVALSAEQRELVDNGRLYTRINPDRGKDQAPADG